MLPVALNYAVDLFCVFLASCEGTGESTDHGNGITPVEYRIHGLTYE